MIPEVVYCSLLCCCEGKYTRHENRHPIGEGHDGQYAIVAADFCLHKDLELPSTDPFTLYELSVCWVPRYTE